MKALIIALFAIGATVIDAQVRQVDTGKKVVCVYNSTSFIREGLGKVTLTELEPAVSFCDFLVFGWAGIDPATNKLKSLNEKLDLDEGQGLYRQVTNLKNKYPKLKVLLGVGGNADPNRDIYLQILENPNTFSIFINSAYTYLKTYRFDGLDLAWQFKTNKPKRIRSGIGSFWYSTKKTFGLAGKPLDANAEQHKGAFKDLVRQIKDAIRPDNYILSLTVLPNTNTSVHYDVAALVPNVDFVTLAAYDYQTWERNPYEADYPAPIYGLHDRIPESNIDYQVGLWLQNGAPNHKLIVAIPTHGRSWQLTQDSTKTGVPPILEVENPGQAGIQTSTPGFLSYPEVCGILPNPSNAHLKGEHQPLRIQRDPTHRYGTYAFRLPDEHGNYGFWVGYEDPETAQSKASYAVHKNLAGVAIHDLSNDDFRGSCTGDKYPILRAAKYRLQQPN